MTINVDFNGTPLEFPDGTSHEVIKTTIAKLAAQKGQAPAAPAKPVEKFVSSGEKDQPGWSSPEMIAGNPVTRLAMGAASPVTGLFQLGANLIGQGKGVNEHMQQLKEMKDQGRGEEGFDIPETVGTVASPAFWKMAKYLPEAKTMVQKVLQSAGVGAAGGATAPVDKPGDFTEQKAEQVGGGALFGGVLPPAAAVVSKGARMAYHGLIEPWAAPAAIKGRAYLEAAGNKASEIADLLTQNRQLVPGSAPTAGEAAVPAGRAEFSALQQSAAKAKPSDYLTRTDAQNQARVEALQTFAGNPAKRAEAAAAREARSDPHYEAGEAQVTNDISGLAPLMERPSFGSVVQRAERLAEEKGATFAPLRKDGMLRSMTGKEAQFMKLAYDDLITSTPKSAADTAELEALKGSRKEFLGWMEKTFPELGRARKLYKMDSASINQMDVGQQLEQKLTQPLREDAAQRSGVFASAVRDSTSTLKKATGEPRFQELEDVLTGRQLQSVQGVQDDLARVDRNLEMSRKGAGAGPNALDLATGNLEREAGGKIPNLLHRGVMLANAIITRMEGKVNKKLASEMAAEMLDPPTVGRALKDASSREARNKALADAIWQASRPATAGAAASIVRGE